MTERREPNRGRFLLGMVLGLLAVAAVESTGMGAEPQRQGLRHPDFSGVWESPGAEYVTMVDDNHPQFTPTAAANLAWFGKYYDPVNDEPTRVCLLKGMPWTILLRPRNYPVEIYQAPDRITMAFELYDTHRTIFLNRKTIPESVPPSGNGYSIGHWDGDALVIETGQLTGLNPIGPYQRSAKAKIMERWTFEHHEKLGQVLHIDVTVIDPDVYAVPGRGNGILMRSPVGTLVGGYNCTEWLWDQYIEKRQAEIKTK